MRRRWTAAEDAEARELVADGYSAAEIAAVLGNRSKCAVQYRMLALHVDRRAGRSRPDVDQRDRMLDMIAAGLTLPAIARALGRSRITIYGIAKRLEAEGLVTRTGWSRWTRWRVTKRWTDGDGEG